MKIPKEITIYGMVRSKLKTKKINNKCHKIISPIYNGMYKDLKSQGFNVKISDGNILICNKKSR